MVHTNGSDDQAEIDAVDICVPPQHHASVAMEAIEAGCHVIVEKPMAFKERDAWMLIQAAEKKGVKLYPIHNSLFIPVIRKVKSLIDSGYIGDIISVDCIYLVSKDDPMIQNPNHWVHKLPGGVLVKFCLILYILLCHFWIGLAHQQ